MFERYTERARRVLFFARYEATQLGSTQIETEHLLLGLIREGKGLTSRIFARSHLSLESIRKEIEGRTVFREKVSTSVEIPFSAETKRVLQFAAEEADRLLHNYIGTEHLLLGILREERSVAASILMEKGLRLNTVREDLVQLLNEKTTLTRVKETPLLAEFSRDLTESAMKNQLDPLVGREHELERVQQVLGADVVVQQPVSLFGRELQHALGLRAEGDLHRGRDLFPKHGSAFDFLADVFERQVRARENPAREPFAFADQAQQEMLGLDGDAAELAGLITGEEEYSSGPFGVPFEHPAYLVKAERVLSSDAMNPV